MRSELIRAATLRWRMASDLASRAASCSGSYHGRMDSTSRCQRLRFTASSLTTCLHVHDQLVEEFVVLFVELGLGLGQLLRLDALGAFLGVDPAGNEEALEEARR